MTTIGVRTPTDLIVWQKAVDLVVAAGRRRGWGKDFRNFLVKAYGSGAELETRIVIARRLPFGQTLDSSASESLLGEVMRMLNRMISSLQATS